ncbi:Sec-independent protein translocase subunit TatA [Kitasatospora sp. NPDC004240]
MLRNGFEPWHLLIVIAVLLLLFGSSKLPDAARALGRSMRILKAETHALREDGRPQDGPPITTSPYPDADRDHDRVPRSLEPEKPPAP